MLERLIVVGGKPQRFGVVNLDESKARIWRFRQIFISQIVSDHHGLDVRIFQTCKLL